MSTSSGIHASIFSFFKSVWMMNTVSNRQSLLQSAILFTVSLAIFTIGLSGQEIISFDSRVYLFAQEMWRHGISWFPTTYGEPYPDYPVASTVLIYGAASLFGGLNKLTAIFPSAVAAALTVVVTHKIGRLHDKKLGTYAVFSLLTTLAFFKSARAIALDTYPTLFTAACFYLVHSAHVKAAPGRVKWIYLLFVAGFVFRGPIGLVIPTGVVCTYYLLDGNYRKFLVTGLLATVLLLLCCAALMMIANHAGGPAFMQDVWRMEVMGRMGNQFLPLYFYFADSFVSYAITFPFAFAVMLGVIYSYFKPSLRSSDTKFLLKLSGWALIILLGMSVPGDKKVRYVLPMAPALALLCGYLWSAQPAQRYFRVLHYAIIYLYLFLPILLCTATIFVWRAAVLHGLPSSLPFLPMIVFFALLQAANLFFYLTDTAALWRRLSWVIFCGSFCFIVANLFLVEPIELYVDRTRDFVHSVERLRLQKHAKLVFYREQPDGLPIKYLVNMTVEEMPVFVASESELPRIHEPAIFITSAEYFDQLPKAQRKKIHIIAAGRIGHVDVIVFGK
jgi:4-amino-4-deoxy-L-arabinose transferase-like glycosyltransferase